MVSLPFIEEKALSALESLAIGDDDFSERLKEAWLVHLYLITTHDANLDIVDDLDWVLSFCQQWEDEGCGSVDETDRIMLTNRLIRMVVATARVGS